MKQLKQPHTRRGHSPLLFIYCYAPLACVGVGEVDKGLARCVVHGRTARVSQHPRRVRVEHQVRLQHGTAWVSTGQHHGSGPAWVSTGQHGSAWANMAYRSLYVATRVPGHTYTSLRITYFTVLTTPKSSYGSRTLLC